MEFKILYSKDQYFLDHYRICYYYYKRIYHKFSDALISYHTCPKFASKICLIGANSLAPNQTPRSAASDLGLHCLLRQVSPKTQGEYGRLRSDTKDQGLHSLQLVHQF